MTAERRFADPEGMRPVVRAAFGRSRALPRVERLAHGSKKGAYRLTMDHGGTALGYAWDGSEDYRQGVLPEGADDPADPLRSLAEHHLQRALRFPARRPEASAKLTRKFLNKSLDGPALQAYKVTTSNIYRHRGVRSPQLLSSLEGSCRSEDGLCKPHSSLARRSG